jgi:NTE family protein
MPEERTESTKTILIFQGGGALGAYECGVYKALEERGFADTLAVVAGTSIGAINASLVAKHFHEPRHGAAFLEQFWTETLARESWPFFAPPLFPCTDPWPRWNAVWTSLLLGHPHLFTPRLGWLIPWILRPPPSWLMETHFYESEPMERVLSQPEVFGSYDPGKRDPRLLVTAVDVVQGEAVAFDSGKEPLRAAHVVASGSLPPTYPPKKIEGVYAGSYCDGGILSNTPLPEVLDVLRGSTGETRYHICVVDVHPQKAERVPSTNGEVFHRISELSYAGETKYDVTATEWVNEYINLVRMLQRHEKELPASVKGEIDRMVAEKQLNHYHEIRQHKRVHVDITVIHREAYPCWEMEQISHAIDFSPARIAELIEQGYQQGRTHPLALERVASTLPSQHAPQPARSSASTLPDA